MTEMAGRSAAERFVFAALCTAVDDCEAVNNSEFAVVAGIPVALLGFGMWRG